jgi:hypothetical protein
MQLREDNNDNNYDDCEWKSKITMVMTLMTMKKKFYLHDFGNFEECD